MNNQECKIKPKIVNFNSEEPVFFPFSIKTSKCSGNCNNNDYPCATLCVPDAVKNLNLRVFNLMWRTNEARHIEWYETCKCKCRLNASVCNNRQRWNEDKCRGKCKELIVKVTCDKRFIWNPNCESQCDIGEYLNYENCKRRRKLVDKLVEECSENVEQVKMAKITSTEDGNKHKTKCSSWTLQIVLFSKNFTINVGNGTYRWTTDT